MSVAPESITVATGQLTARLMNEASETLASIATTISQAAQAGAHLLVLPECAYPAYLLGSVTSYRAGDHLTSQEFVAWLRRQAKEHRLHIVSGFVEDAGKVLYNSAILIDHRGREIGRSRKRFLWNADHNWFAPGDEIRAFDTEIGRIGMVICAETRTPEILATLAEQGTQLIAMPTCWINVARDPRRFENPQVEFLIEARAREFGMPFVCADKSGLEMTTGYVGQSRIVRTDGSTAAQASPTGEELTTAELTLQETPKVQVAEHDRRRLLDTLPPVYPSDEPSRHVSVAVMSTAAINEHMANPTSESFLESLRDRNVEILIANIPSEIEAEKLIGLARNYGINALGSSSRTDVFTLGAVQVGCVTGEKILSFAASRVLALQGAEVLLFFDMPDDLAIVRARAMENRVFVIGVNQQSAIIIGPGGAVLARNQSGEPAEVVAEIDLSEAANKLTAPKTDVFDERRVELYHF